MFGVLFSAGTIEMLVARFCKELLILQRTEVNVMVP